MVRPVPVGAYTQGPAPSHTMKADSLTCAEDVQYRGVVSRRALGHNALKSASSSRHSRVITVSAVDKSHVSDEYTVMNPEK